MEEIIIEKVNYKAFIIALANLFFLMAAVAITASGYIADKRSYRLLGIFASVVLLITFIIAVCNARKVKSLLTITRDGVIDNSSISGVGYISFDEIKEFIIITVNYKRSIAVIPKNVDHFLSKLNVVKRGLAKRNINSNLPPVMIPVDLAKDMEPEDILSLLRKRLSDYSSLYE
jgi:hypothetical protein